MLQYNLNLYKLQKCDKKGYNAWKRISSMIID